MRLILVLCTLLAAIACTSVRPASAEKVEATPKLLARGAYLADHVLNCMHCHSEGDPNVWGMPPRAGTAGTGGNCWDPSGGFPGRVCASNLTPDPDTGLGRWTDGEILRALREGVSRNGQPLVTIMPYLSYRSLSDEDARAVVAYLRTLQPVRKQIPPRRLDFPESVLVNLDPKPIDGPVHAPDPKSVASYGRYLATVASCLECHTPLDARYQPIPGREFAGGREFPLPGGAVVRSPNITPHDTGMGEMDQKSFVRRFKTWSDADVGLLAENVAPDRNSAMGWVAESGMTEEDLGAIWAFLQTVPPLDNHVRVWPRSPETAGAPER